MRQGIWLAIILAGCAGMEAKYPQTADEFLTTYNWGGLFQNKESVTVKRSQSAVVADMREFAVKCMDITVNKRRMARYATDKYSRAPSSEAIPYNAKVARLKTGAMALSIQEVSGDTKGVPADGMYTVLAEVRGVSQSSTQVNIYHLAKPFIANPLKKWVDGDKRECPAL